jgi:hypothetical protein
MSKHKRRKNHEHTEEPEKEMLECSICKKRCSWNDYPLSPFDTPFMFVAVYDKTRRGLTILPVSEDPRLRDTEKGLWFICADRRCIYKTFLKWRNGDVMISMARGIIAKQDATPDEKQVAREVLEDFEVAVDSQQAFTDANTESSGFKSPQSGI